MNRRSFFLNGVTALVAGVASPGLAESIAQPAAPPANPPSSEGLWFARIRKLPAPHNQVIDDKHLIHIVRNGDDVRCDIHEIWTRRI